MLQLGILSLGFHSLLYNTVAVKWIKSMIYSVLVVSSLAVNMPQMFICHTRLRRQLFLCFVGPSMWNRVYYISVCKKKSRFVIKYGKKNFNLWELRFSHRFYSTVKPFGSSWTAQILMIQELAPLNVRNHWPMDMASNQRNSQSSEYAIAKVQSRRFFSVRYYYYYYY
jgi:hypothetical protein